MTVTGNIVKMISLIEFYLGLHARGQVIDETSDGTISELITHGTACVKDFYAVDLDSAQDYIAERIGMVLLDRFQGSRRPTGCARIDTRKLLNTYRLLSQF